MARLTIEGTFEFVLKNPEAFTIGVAGMSGSSPKMRQKVQEALGDLAEDIRIYQLLPMLSDAAIKTVSAVMIRQIFTISPGYVDAPGKREEIRKTAYDLMITLAAGAIALEIPVEETMLSLAAILRSAGRAAPPASSSSQAAAHTSCCPAA